MHNLVVYLGFLEALSIAAIVTMPRKAPLIHEDHPLQELWNWFRDTLQTAVPAARHNKETESKNAEATTK